MARVENRKGVRVYTVKKRKPMKQLLKEQYGDKESSIETKIRLFLEAQGIFFVQEKRITYQHKTRYYDFYVTDGRNYTFFIEADGDYFHDPKGKTRLQKKNKRNDLFKDKIAKAKGIPLLRMKEKDIRYNFQKVAHEIFQEIHRQSGEGGGNLI